jgi:tRNA threonylcarbamoyladenosine biosynthesis protein TsaB
MNLLAVDTSTAGCSVALIREGRLMAEAVYTAGKTHSRHLLSTIHAILSSSGFYPEDIHGIAVTTGPGTFTGLRIGISTVKGLAVATGAQVVGVSSLAALAFPFAQLNCTVVAMIDARRGEIYHASFRCGMGNLQPAMAVALDAPEATAALLPEDAIVVGSGAVLYREVLQSRRPGIRFGDPTQHVIRAGSVGMLAMRRFSRQDVDRTDTLLPEYVRKSDAQVHLSGSC